MAKPCTSNKQVDMSKQLVLFLIVVMFLFGFVAPSAAGPLEELLDFQRTELTVFGFKAAKLKANTVSLKRPPTLEESYTVVKSGLAIKDFPCAKLLDITARKDPGFYEATCLVVPEGRKTIKYLLDVATGNVSEL